MEAGKFDAVQRDVLIEGTEDVVGLWEVARSVREEIGNASADRVREDTIERLRPLLDAGLIQAGQSPYVTGEFIPWGLAPSESIERIDREWRQLGRDPDIPDICWFGNTESGNELARGFLAAVERDGSE